MTKPYIYSPEAWNRMQRTNALFDQASGLFPYEKLEEAVARKEEDYEPVSFEDCAVVRRSDLAILVRVEDQTVWIPKSQIHDDSEVYDSGPEDRGDTGTLVIPMWLAVDKALV